jgi:hypothetical protein
LNPAKYSYSWALSIVEKAYESHARATDIFNEIHGLSHKQLAKLLAEGRMEWTVLRDILKTLDKWRLTWPDRMNTTQALTDICVGKGRKMPLKLRWYLTARINAIEFKSRVQGGVTDRGEAE